MKQLIYILLTTTMLGLMSCSDWLDVSPKTSIPTDKQFESESGFKDALTGIYLKLGTKTLYAGDLTYAYLDELAGLYSDYPGYNTNAVFNQSIVFDYENMFLSKKNGIYSAMYNIIANINNFLEYVDKNKDVLVTERYYETMKGEALGLRAFLHFDLLRMFGPIYKEHPTSKAMLARVYCYKGDAESKGLAVEYAKQVIAASEYFTLYKSQTASSYNSIRYAEQIFGITVNEFSNLLIGNYMDMENTNIQQHFYLDGDKFNTFYETASAGNTDWRRIAEMFEVVDGASQTNVFCRKYNQKPLNDGYTYSGANAVPLIRLPEMYYIVAECASSASESADALNTVRFARGISYSDEIPTTGYDDLDTTSEEDKNQTKRINEIMKEYRKEYFAEGQLFYFLKAHNYSTYYGCGVETMTEAHYQMTLPDDEYIFGNNSK